MKSDGTAGEHRIEGGHSVPIKLSVSIELGSSKHILFSLTHVIPNEKGVALTLSLGF